MRWVTEYRRFAGECRRLAATLTKPADKRALELMAKGWDKSADEREAKLHSSDDLFEATLEPRQPAPVEEARDEPLSDENHRELLEFGSFKKAQKPWPAVVV
jgi:hypothetical protein